MQNVKFRNIDEYHAQFSDDTLERLETLRAIIQEEAPQAKEVISYGMPAFKMKRVLVFYAAWKEHLGFYPSGSGIAAFQDKLDGYESSKGAIRLPYDKPLPEELIREIVRFRVKEDGEKK